MNATNSVMNCIERSDTLSLLVSMNVTDMANANDNDLLNIMVDLFDGDTTTDGMELADANLDILRDFFTEL